MSYSLALAFCSYFKHNCIYKNKCSYYKKNWVIRRYSVRNFLCGNEVDIYSKCEAYKYFISHGENASKLRINDIICSLLLNYLKEEKTNNKNLNKLLYILTERINISILTYLIERKIVTKAEFAALTSKYSPKKQLRNLRELSKLELIVVNTENDFVLLNKNYEDLIRSIIDYYHSRK